MGKHKLILKRLPGIHGWVERGYFIPSNSVIRQIIKSNAKTVPYMTGEPNVADASGHNSFVFNTEITIYTQTYATNSIFWLTDSHLPSFYISRMKNGQY